MSALTLSDFVPGDKVLYVPGVAQGDERHEACERGVVSSTNDHYVFVRYYRRDGTLPDGGVATHVSDLRILGSGQ